MRAYETSEDTYLCVCVQLLFTISYCANVMSLNCQMCSCCTLKKKRSIQRRPSSKKLIEDEEDSREAIGAEGKGGRYMEFGTMSLGSDDEDEDDDDDDFDAEIKEEYHSIIIDCAPIGFTDAMGVAMMEQVCAIMTV